MAELLPHIKGPKATIVGQDPEGRPLWNTIISSRTSAGF
jgi:hypothetical protein